MATHAPTNYDAQREKLAEYFDRTARKAWIDLTSDAKVSGIRATVRAGRERMRDTLLGWLPQDLRRTRILDAGCGTGALSVAAACREKCGRCGSRTTRNPVKCKPVNVRTFRVLRVV